MFSGSILVSILQFIILLWAVATIVSFLIRNPKYFLISIVGLMSFVTGLTYLEKYEEQTQTETQQKEEEIFHSQLLFLPEGCYILDRIVSADSVKVRFILQLPGIAKRQVEVIAYDNSPIFWNEWQAESAIPGDTLVIRDVWTSYNSGSTYAYNRTIQKLGPDDVGLGYVTLNWIERKGSVGRNAWPTPPEK